MRQVWRELEPTQELLMKPLKSQGCESATLVIQTRPNRLFPMYHLQESFYAKLLKISRKEEINVWRSYAERWALFSVWWISTSSCGVWWTKHVKHRRGAEGKLLWSHSQAERLRLWISLNLLRNQVSVPLLLNSISVFIVRLFLSIVTTAMNLGPNQRRRQQI